MAPAWPAWRGPSAAWPRRRTVRRSAWPTPSGRTRRWSSGSRRDEARLIRAIPGSVAKAGAESVYAVGLPDGTGIVVKVDDGAARVRPVLMVAALERLGVLELPGVDADAVRDIGRVQVLGGGVPVGEIRATF